MDIKLIVDLYEKEKLSIRQIAEQVGTYPQAIARALAKQNVKMRDKSQAQEIALKTGRSKHPTEGKEISENTRLKLSQSIKKSWSDSSDEEIAKRKSKAKKNWDEMPLKDKQDFLKKGNEAVRAASVVGSKLELFLANKLRENGYDVILHKKNLIPNDKLEVDIFLPALDLAIEVDGPSHFSPIWGEDKLKKNRTADAKKGGLLNSAGFSLFRLKQMQNHVSLFLMENAFERLIENIEIYKNSKDIVIREIEVGN